MSSLLDVLDRQQDKFTDPCPPSIGPGTPWRYPRQNSIEFQSSLAAGTNAANVAHRRSGGIRRDYFNWRHRSALLIFPSAYSISIGLVVKPDWGSKLEPNRTSPCAVANLLVPIPVAESLPAVVCTTLLPRAKSLFAVVHGKHVVFAAGAVFVDQIASAALGL
jgi:hypothetical protein